MAGWTGGDPGTGRGGRIRGGLPPRRPDQQFRPVGPQGPVGSSTAIVRARLVLVSGPNDGIFVYNQTRTALESSDCAAATTDPVLGIPCPQGFATYNAAGFVISLLSTANKAFFQYADTGTSQGQLISALSSASGVDPVAGFFYGSGLYGLDPFGNSITTFGPTISFNAIAFTRAASIKPDIGSGATQPGLQLDAPEQTTASHLQMLMSGASPDGSKIAQLIIGAVAGSATLSPFGQSLLEVHGIQTLIEPLSTSQALNVGVTTETQNRFKVRADGLQQWGTGAAPVDTSLYRAAAAQLAADNIAANIAGTAETWHTIAPNAGFSAGPVTPRFRKEPIGGGVVRLAGQISLTAAEAGLVAMFSLPAAYAPAQAQGFATPNSLSGFTAGSRSVKFDAGSPVCSVVPSGAIGNSVTLDGITFPLD